MSDPVGRRVGDLLPLRANPTMPMVVYTEEEQVEAENKAAVEGALCERRRLRMLIPDLVPDTSATAPEHLIGFRAGWREALAKVLTYLSSD